MDCQTLRFSCLEETISKPMLFSHFCNRDTWYELSFKCTGCNCGSTFFTSFWLAVNLCICVLLLWKSQYGAYSLYDLERDEVV